MADTTNFDRLLLELKGLEEGFDKDVDQGEIHLRLQESGLNSQDIYNPASKTNLKKIYMTAVSILESIANNPKLMKNYKTEDLTITHFHTNLMNRIDYLNRKIRLMADDDEVSLSEGATFTYMFLD